MPVYIYKVKNDAGKVYNGEARTANRNELMEILAENRLTPIEVTEKNALTDISTIGIFKKKVKTKDLAVFCRQFAIELEAGVPISQAMDVLREQSVNKTLKEALNDIYEDIQKGKTLSSAMKKHADVFPDILISMTEAGEISGQLDIVFVRMAGQFEKDAALKSKISSAMVYPVIVLTIAVLVIFIMMAYVVPTFAGVLTDLGGQLPAYTKLLISISMFFKHFWWIMLILLVGLVFGLKVFSKSAEGKRFISRLAISLPIIRGITKLIITARFTRSLGTLVGSGVLLLQAMEIVKKVVGNTFVAEKLDFVLAEINKGKGMTAPLAGVKYFPPLLLSMVRVGEESGDLDLTLSKTADFYDQEVDAAIHKLTTFIEPLIMVVLGGVVAFIMFSIMYPMISVYKTIGNQ